MKSLPEISIIGAPKCGTSSVHTWLSQLPGICASTPKETFFFMDVGNPLTNPACNFHQDGIEAYRRFFPRAVNGKMLDSTTHYLYQDTARQHFAAHGTKTCAILRNPARRLISYFEYVCYTRCAVRKPIDFSEFVDALFVGDAGRFREFFFEEREFYPLAMGLRHGQYVDYLSRWKDELHPENLKVVVFEHLVKNQREVLLQLAEFIGITVAPEDLELPVENETVAIRYPLVNRVVKSVANTLFSKKLTEPLKKIYYSIQKTEKVDLIAKHAAELERLAEYYDSFNSRLEKELGIDVSMWKPN